MRRILLVAATAGVLTAAFGGTASAQCMQWPNPLGWDQVEVCHPPLFEPAG